METKRDRNMSRRNKMVKKKGSRKKPGSAAPPKTYSRGELGESIFERTQEYGLVDPNMNIMSMQYNSLHDPHLKHFFNQRGKKQHLKKLRLITDDNKVLCTLKEFMDYMRYREACHLSCEKHLLEKQKHLLKHFMMLKQEGEMPETISISDIIDWLINKGIGTFRKIYKQNIKAGSNPNYDEVLWKVRQRLLLEKMEKEVIQELRLERRSWDRKNALKKPVRTPWTSKLHPSSPYLQHPVLQPLHEETEESFSALPRSRVSAGLTGLFGVVNKITSESPGKSANALNEISAIVDSSPQKSPLTSIQSLSPLSTPSSESPKDQVQTAVLEELNKLVKEISAACLMSDTEDRKKPPMDDFELKKDIEVITLDDSVVQASSSQVESLSVHPNISENVMKFAVDEVRSLLSKTEASLTPRSSQALVTETETLESKNLESAVLSEMMLRDLVKEMVEELVQSDIHQKKTVRVEVQTSQSGNQLAREVPNDLSLDLAENLCCSLQNNLTIDIVRSALDRVSVVISEKEALFCQQKAEKASRASDSSSMNFLEESDGSVESLNYSNNPLRNLARHLHVETKTALYEALRGIQDKIERGDLSDCSEPTVSPENLGMIVDLITEIVKVCTVDEDASDTLSTHCNEEMGNCPTGGKQKRKQKHDFFERVWQTVKQVITSGKRSSKAHPIS